MAETGEQAAAAAPAGEEEYEAQRWMVGVDGSIASHAALAWATTNMHKNVDTLYLVTVTNEREHKQRGVESLKGFADDFCAEAGVKKFETIERSGSPLEVLCLLVKELKIDNLVVGRRGMSKDKRDQLGSTSAHVVTAADCNVIVIKHQVRQ
eukprot:TRINITY_DN1867_c0_g1_i2.p1 TRINITY_DN1867_c0_g1~~TRINITY_DN1867_c0_g1_i2.p1  ORF type:complete len:152 (+),score=36.23 TRINITY_DN1867_c0_g1_i2:99-554(+)